MWGTHCALPMQFPHSWARGGEQAEQNSRDIEIKTLAAVGGPPRIPKIPKITKTLPNKAILPWNAIRKSNSAQKCYKTKHSILGMLPCNLTWPQERPKTCNRKQTWRIVAPIMSHWHYIQSSHDRKNSQKRAPGSKNMQQETKLILNLMWWIINIKHLLQ